MSMRDVATDNVEARLEWWRRAAFSMMGVLIVGMTAWLSTLASDVEANADANADRLVLLTQLQVTQQALVRQVAELNGRFDAVMRQGQQRDE